MLNNLRSWWENFYENYKRVILTILFSIIVAFLAYTIYYVFFKPKPPAPTIGLPIEIPITTLPLADIRAILEERGIPIEEKIEVPALPLSELKPDAIAQGGRTLAKPQVYTSAQNVSLNKTGNLNYYNQADSKFYTLDDQGQLKALSDQIFPNVEQATWSPQGDKAILEFPDGSNIFYDFNEQKQYTLPREGQGFAFSTAGHQIAYKFITENPDENWLIISLPTGSNSVALEHIGTTNPQDILVNWSPDNSRVATFRSSVGLDSEEIFFVGQSKENFKSLSVEGRGFEGLWSPQGNKLLYNVYSAQSGYRPQLWITNARDDNMGINKKNLGLYTWVSKCTFAPNSTAYCAVPLYLKQGTGIYPQLADAIPDVIYKINLATGFKQQIAVPTNALGIGLYTVEKLMLSPNGKVLYMVDKGGGIYEIRLE